MKTIRLSQFSGTQTSILNLHMSKYSINQMIYNKDMKYIYIPPSYYLQTNLCSPLSPFTKKNKKIFKLNRKIIIMNGHVII